MSIATEAGRRQVRARISLRTIDGEVESAVTVPAGPARLSDLLGVAQTVADSVVAAGIASAEAQGQTTSCKKGCGACCRQLVPISATEARGLVDLIEQMPEPRRTVVQERFAQARRQLEASGLLEHLMHRHEWEPSDLGEHGDAYFRQGIPCPFLEDESCSIYADRPIICREYVVTTPAELCAQGSAEQIRRVRMPVQLWSALARFDEVPAGSICIPWVPLILAPEWAQGHPDEAPARPGPELLRDYFSYLTTGRRAALAEQGDLDE
jgi:Fe-S-cluster containining protein